MKTHRQAEAPAVTVNIDRLSDDAYVRLPVVRELLGGVSKPTVWRWAKAGRIPAPRKLSEQVSAWNVGQLRKALRGESWK